MARVGQPYEPPLGPDTTLETRRCSPRECAQKILEKILYAEAGAKSRV